VDDGVLIEVVHCSHDAILEFLFGCHPCGAGRIPRAWMAQQAVQVAPAPYATLITPQHVGGGGVK
jgi:hypothetical protein